MLSWNVIHSLLVFTVLGLLSTQNRACGAAIITASTRCSYFFDFDPNANFRIISQHQQSSSTGSSCLLEINTGEPFNRLARVGVSGTEFSFGGDASSNGNMAAIGQIGWTSSFLPAGGTGAAFVRINIRIFTPLDPVFCVVRTADGTVPILGEYLPVTFGAPITLVGNGFFSGTNGNQSSCQATIRQELYSDTSEASLIPGAELIAIPEPTAFSLCLLGAIALAFANLRNFSR